MIQANKILPKEGVCRDTSGGIRYETLNKSVLKSFLQTLISNLVCLILHKILEILHDSTLVAVFILISAFCTQYINHVFIKFFLGIFFLCFIVYKKKDKMLKSLGCKTSCLLLLATQTSYLQKHETITLKNKTFIKCTSNLFQIISMYLNVKTGIVFYSWFAHRKEKKQTRKVQNYCFSVQILFWAVYKNQANQLEITKVGHGLSSFDSLNPYSIST